MKALPALALKTCMAGVFFFWVLNSRKARSAGEAAPLNIAFIVAALSFSLASFAILAGVYLTASAEVARFQALLYLFAFLLTLSLECSFAAFFSARGYRSAKELGCVALCSLVTHPALHLVAFLPEQLFGEDLFDDHWVWYLEAMIVVAESFILNRSIPHRRADNAKLALAMNAFSFYSGLAISWGLWWMLG
jgi:hypothetical protein